jgi:rhodanese-related sulfurtransferase
LLRDAVLIVVLATLLGVLVNFRLLRQVWSGQPPVSAVPAATPSDDEFLPMPVALAELREMPAGAVLFLDARNVDLYRQGHLPGALSLPLEDVDSRLESFRREVPIDRALVAYCSGYGCEDSFRLAQRLMAAGYADVRVFEGGVPEWQDAGLPVEAGQP